MPPTSDEKKRKADAEAKGAPKSKKMTKEQKQAARERARQAMQEDSSAPASAKKKATTTKATPKAAPKTTPAVRKSPKRVAAAKVTISEDAKPPAAPAAMEMPLPPTTLMRTQSTPLELELEHQVVANLKADLAGQTPVFTEAPPEHLLKFAPTELEEGYDHDEANAGDPLDTTNPTPQRQQAPAAKCPIPHHLLNGTFLLELLAIGVWCYMFWGREGTFYHRWSHGVMARMPLLPYNPYRTAEGKPIPFMPCFHTNVDDPPVSMRADCVDIPNELCPHYGDCYGGHLQACKGPYLELDPNGKKCRPLPSVQKVFDHVMEQVSSWALDHQCDTKSNPKLFVDRQESPSSYMMHSLRSANPPLKLPMFELQKVLDDQPFLLMKVPQGGFGRNPIQSLYHLVEVANNVAGNPLKLQILNKYSDMIEGTEEREILQVELAAKIPSQAALWWRSTSNQCSLLKAKASFDYTLRTPWFIGVWVSCIFLFVLWVFVMRYYWMKAEQQQFVLASIEHVRRFVLQTLESNPSKKWKGPELLEYVVRNGPAFDDEQLLRKRIWPRVVFDVRGNPSVGKTVIVSGADLVDVWNWQPRQEQAAAQAPNEAGGA